VRAPRGCAARVSLATCARRTAASLARALHQLAGTFHNWTFGL
jgi:hypothetical protein